MKKPLKPKKIGRAAIYAVLKTVLPEKQARRVAGFSLKTNSVPNTSSYQLEVAEIRKRLSDMPGYVSYLDMLEKLAVISDDPEAGHSVKVNAIKEINKMQGYNAPLLVELEKRVNIKDAVDDLKELMSDLSVTPSKLREELKRRESEETVDAILEKVEA